MRTPQTKTNVGPSLATLNRLALAVISALVLAIVPAPAFAQDAGVDAGDAGVQQPAPPPPLSPTAAGSTIPVLAGQVVAQSQRAAAAEARERALQTQLDACNARARDLQTQLDRCNGGTPCSEQERTRITTEITTIRRDVSHIRRDLRAVRAELREVRQIAEGARDDARRAQTTADGAQRAADQAQRTADDAAGAAEDANRAAADAQTTADGAVTVNNAQNVTLTRHEAAIRGVNTAVRALTRVIPEGYALASLNILVPTQSGRDTVLGGGLQIGTTWYPSSGSWVTFDIAGSVSPFRGVALATFGGGLMGGGRAGDSVLLGAGLRLLNLQVTDRIAPANGQDGLAAGSLGWMITPSVRATYAPRDSRFRCGVDLGVGIGGSLGTHVMLNLGCGAAFNATAESVTSSLRDPGPPPAATQN